VGSNAASISLALVGRPEIAFSTSRRRLDPARRRSWDLIESLRDLGTTIVLTRTTWTRWSDWPTGSRHRAGELVALDTPGRLGTGPKLVRDLPGAGRRRRRVAAAARRHEVVVDDGMVSVETGVPTAVLHTLTGWRWRGGARRSTVRRPARGRLPRAHRGRPHECGGTCRRSGRAPDPNARRNRLLLFFTSCCRCCSSSCSRSS
jgi:hypothetical protein